MTSTTHDIICGKVQEKLHKWAGQAHFVFADPPFNVGEPYDEHDDNMPHERFVEFTKDWLTEAVAALRPGGVLAINIPDDMVELILWGMRQITGTLQPLPLNRIDWIIWHYRFGQCTRHKFISSKTHCLVYADDRANYTWNPDSILVESLRSSLYNDKRIDDTENGGMRVPFDVWTDIPRVVGNAKERMPNHPNQLPERYLERLILAYTNVGDCLVDCFGGSGTLAGVACRLQRSSVTFEQSAAYCKDISERVFRENALNTIKAGLIS